MDRTVEPEWLDELPANDPDATGSRRDLVRLNRIMGHAETMLQLLQQRTNSLPPRRIVEIGAGDGTFALRIAKKLAVRWPSVDIMLVDAKDAVADDTKRAFHHLGWKMEIVAADVFDFLQKPDTGPADIMVANLFLHQFSRERLRLMLQLIAKRTKLFAACEPLRGALPFALSKLVWFIGCNAVTQHDAPCSVRAGFAGGEISELWPEQSQWRLQERSTKLFTQTFFAERTNVA